VRQGPEAPPARHPANGAGRLPALLGLLRSGEGRKLLRYSLASVVSVAVSQGVLFAAFGLLHWPARTANVVACAVGTVPSYHLNRTWTWGRRGRSRLWGEVMPFWMLAFLGLALSTWATGVASATAHAAASPLSTTLAVMSAALAAFGVLWVGRFLLFNRLLFADRPRRPCT
jgi:putative flippase GtrA